jgi:dsRNA-specific ribonuclease/signal transduction histidine kinase
VNQVEFRNELQQLSTRVNSITFDAELWESVFTHASYRRELLPDDISTERLVELLQRIGAEGLRLAIFEYCLDQKGMDEVETSRAFQTRTSLLSTFIDEFHLVRLCKAGTKFSGLATNKSLQLELALRFLGLITTSSSYRNVRELIWDRIEKSLFQSPEWLNYEAVDPKSWLQEYCQRFYGKPPTYQLISETGPEHEKTFVTRVTLPDKRWVEASGSSLKVAQKQAAAAITNKLQLSRQMPSRPKPKLAGRTPPYLNPPPDRVDKYLIIAAPRVARKLGCDNINKYQLAVALTVPARIRRDVETNLRLKLLGDALETFAFALFIFQEVPIRAFGSSNIAHFAAAICANSQHVPLFDHLGLEPFVCHKADVQLSEPGKAEVIKAIAAAVYLSTRDFPRFFDWIVANLGTWCQESVARLAESPLAINDPKSFLQELFQGQELYKIEYVDQMWGPQHKQVFSTTLFVSAASRRVKVGTGTGNTLKQAQQAAAKQAIHSIVPRSVEDKLAPVATHFWKSYFDRLLTGERGVIVGACGVEQFRRLNSFAGFFGLKAFSVSLPELRQILERPEFTALLARSIGRLAFRSPGHVLSLATHGIHLITSHAPNDPNAFTTPEVENWLNEFRRASSGLKLPSAQLRSPLALVPVHDLCHVRSWKLLVSSADGSSSISEPMFSHIITLLESLGGDSLSISNNADLHSTEGLDWRCVRVVVKKPEWGRLQIEQVIEELLLNAFFAGVVDFVNESPSTLTVEVKGVCFENDEPHVRTYLDVLAKLYQAQGYFQSLHRIVHDLKNQVIALRNYATQAITEVGSRYQMYAAIEQLQQNIRNRETALALFFKTAEQPGFTAVNLQQTIRDFMAKQILALPTNIRPELSVNLDPAQVLASREFLISVLENLTQNAIEAMPNGGVLSISASYKSDDSMLEINVSDTGVGIPPDSIPDLFTSLKSTKAKGMGLGLATVKRIVEQHDGLVDVVSQLGVGTKFTILLPLQRESEVSHARIGN